MSDVVRFVVPGSLNMMSGGYAYDRRIIDGLRALGATVAVVELGGTYPEPSAEDRKYAEEVFVSFPAGAMVVVDGLAFGALPDLAGKEHERLRLVALVHHPLADETGLSESTRRKFESDETRALGCAELVIVSSAFTGRRLADLGVPAERISVVGPGVDPAPLAKGDGHPIRMICPASYIPRKGHAVLFKALAGLIAYDWRLVCVGNTEIDGELFAKLVKLRDELGLAERVELRGAVQERDLAALYDRSDLLVLASHYEGFGMVVTEAIARGIPVVATTGGALGETLPEGAGLLSPPDDVDALAGSLRSFLEDSALRARLAAGAREARKGLTTWSDAAQGFDHALRVLPRNQGAFTRDWLSLREEADSHARDGSLVSEIQLPRRSTLAVLDLGAGTGNNLRYLGPRLPMLQDWTLVDSNLGIPSIDSKPKNVVSVLGRPLDLASDLDGIDFSEFQLVTASAFLDLVSKEWLAHLARRCSEAGVANGLFALSVDGRIAWGPQEPEDEDIVSSFNAHMHRDKGFGPALGPDAPAAVEEVFGALGYEVLSRESPWRLSADDAALQERLLEGYAQAARETDPDKTEMIARWTVRRRQWITQGESALLVGHRDVLVRRI